MALLELSLSSLICLSMLLTILFFFQRTTHTFRCQIIQQFTGYVPEMEHGIFKRDNIRQKTESENKNTVCIYTHI